MDKDQVIKKLCGEIHFLTFAAGNTAIRMAGRRLSREAIKSDIFESVICETENSLKRDSNFWDIHSAFITSSQNTRGWGKWLWKPYIIMKHLERIPENSLLLYLDAGCHLNLSQENSRERFYEYCSIAAKDGALAMQLVNGQFELKEFDDLSEESWCPQDILSYLRVPDSLRKTPQIQAGILLFRNDYKSKEFINNWFDLAILNNYAFLQDYPRSSLGNVNFRGHRYDQSIFSPLYKLSKLPTIADETWFQPNWKIQGASFPIWAMRNKSGKDFRENFFWNIRQRILHIIFWVVSTR
jgi:hypothetical protein